MDIHVDIRGFLRINVWICSGFSDQGGVVLSLFSPSARHRMRDMFHELATAGPV